MRKIFLATIILVIGTLRSPVGRAETIDLYWKDLMPIGEEETLNQLYEEFYENLQSKIDNQIAAATPLSQVDPASGGDMGVDAIMEGSPLDQMEQIGTFNTVDDLDGESVRLPGYIVPIDFRADEKYTEFLLVPYFGACLHSPPPPPNQIVFVQSEEPVKVSDIYAPYTIEGTLQTERQYSEIGNAAYTMVLTQLELFEYDD